MKCWLFTVYIFGACVKSTVWNRSTGRVVLGWNTCCSGKCGTAGDPTCPQEGPRGLQRYMALIYTGRLSQRGSTRFTQRERGRETERGRGREREWEGERERGRGRLLTSFIVHFIHKHIYLPHLPTPPPAPFPSPPLQINNSPLQGEGERGRERERVRERERDREREAVMLKMSSWIYMI